MAKPKIKVPNTISDQQMASLRWRAARANGDLAAVASKPAIARRKAAAKQRLKAGLS